MAETALEIQSGGEFWADALLSSGHMSAYGSLLDAEFVMQLSIDIMEAHVKATDRFVAHGYGGWLTIKEIDDYHKEVFEKHGLSGFAYDGWWAPGSFYCPDCRLPDESLDDPWGTDYCRGCPK